MKVRSWVLGGLLLLSAGCDADEMDTGGDDGVASVGSIEQSIERGPTVALTPITGNPYVKARYVVAAGDLQETGEGQNVLIGHLDLYSDIYTFGGNTGPMATFSYWKYERGVYPAVTCTFGPNRRYDHAPIKVDANCPPVRSGGHGHWDQCEVHVQPRWGSNVAPTFLQGIWSASNTEVHFSWNVGGVKRKDYWFVKKKLPTIHYLELDASRTNGPDSYSPSERTHGFAMGSNRSWSSGVPFATAMQSYNANTFRETEYRWDEGQATTNLATRTGNNLVACNGRTSELWYVTRCYDPENPENPEDTCPPATWHSHTQACLDRGDFLENLVYWSDPWPSVNDRKNAMWMWRACHVTGTGTCYHGQSHAFPAAQAVDDNGVFYGWVSLEHQDDSPTDDFDDDLAIKGIVKSDLVP
jgi:hypothetical protein